MSTNLIASDNAATTIYNMVADDAYLKDDVWPPHKLFNPPKFPPSELIGVLIEWISSPKSLRKICEAKWGADMGYTYYWQGRLLSPVLIAAHAQAMRLRTAIQAQEITDIADDDSRDYDRTEQGENGEIIVYKGNSVRAMRDKLRIQSRQWFLERLDPQFQPKSQSTSLNLNFNASLPTHDEVAKMAPSDVLKLFQ